MNRYLYVAAIRDDDYIAGAGGGVRFASTFVEAEDGSIAYDDGYEAIIEMGEGPDVNETLLNDYVVCLGPLDMHGDGYYWDVDEEQYLER